MVNIREIAVEALLQITEEEKQSHVVLRNVLEKHQYLEKRDRALISRIVIGTLENMIRIDYMIEQFSKITIAKMKPLIRNLLRISVYQICFLENIPDSAAVNEALKIAQKHGFFELKAYINGVLRNIARNKNSIIWPDRSKTPAKYLSVMYSVPEWLVKKWVPLYGEETVEKMFEDFQTVKGTSVRCNLEKANRSDIIDSLKAQNIAVKESPYLDYALEIFGYNYLKAVDAFKKGWFQVQDVSSMLVAEAADPKWGDYCIDVCAAPGGKSLHLADKLRGSGFVEARDITIRKVNLMQENIERINLVNMSAIQQDATVFDPTSIEKADILLADLPCSGLGVIGKKPDIRYKMNPSRMQELVRLQRKILDTVYPYVKVGGTLIYSTCTIGAEENQYNLKWFLENYPFELDSLDPFLCEELHSNTTAAGYLQLLPGVHQTDGFFLARLKRVR